MLYQGIVGGGSSPVEPEDLSPVLLWTNPSPTSAFAAQTVSLDLTNYIGVIVDFINDDVNYTRSRVYAKKSDSFSSFPIGAGYVSSTNAYSRNIVNVSDTGVQFSDAATTSAQNQFVIPFKIYGVKEYVVEPVKVKTIKQLSVATVKNTANEKGTAFEMNVSEYTSLDIDNVSGDINTASSYCHFEVLADSTAILTGDRNFSQDNVHVDLTNVNTLKVNGWITNSSDHLACGCTFNGMIFS